MPAMPSLSPIEFGVTEIGPFQIPCCDISNLADLVVNVTGQTEGAANLPCHRNRG
jgi:hypothetical protein